MAPCVVVERSEGKQQYSRAPVGEHAEVQAQDAECSCHEQQEVNEKQPKPRNSPSHNHDSTAPRKHPLIYTGVGLIHPVHGPLRSPAMEAIAPKGFTFSPFWRALFKYQDLDTIISNLRSTSTASKSGLTTYNFVKQNIHILLHACSATVSLSGKNLANNGHSSFKFGSFVEPPEASAAGNFCMEGASALESDFV